MERFGETKKRSEDEGEQGRQIKGRRSGNDAVEFFKQKAVKENEFRAELVLKKQHQQQEAAKQGQILAIMQQQQQQAAAMMTVIERLHVLRNLKTWFKIPAFLYC